MNQSTGPPLRSSNSTSQNLFARLPFSKPRGRRLLSLDGGGTKGLTSLLILRKLMHNIMVEKKLDHLPKPCEYFDLIGGTSTGGLIAIMLGRLCMGIDECIESYKRFSQTIFGDKRCGAVRRVWCFVSGEKICNTAELERAIKQTIGSKCDVDSKMLLSDKESGCKVFVCAIRKANRAEHLFRSYAIPEAPGEVCQCKIWEAARATSAAPLYFKGIKLEGGVGFCDGGMLSNNPVNLVEKEAHKLWPKDRIACLVSIGTGVAKTRPVRNRLFSILHTAVEISTDAQKIADAFENGQQGRLLVENGQYFRFNVDQGMQDAHMDDSGTENMKRMETVTEEYLGRSEIRQDIKTCTRRLIKETMKLTNVPVRLEEEERASLFRRFRQTFHLGSRKGKGKSSPSS